MHLLTWVSTLRTAGLAVACTALCTVAAPALAQDGSLNIQLNKVEASGASCRMTYVINNGTGTQVAAPPSRLQ